MRSVHAVGWFSIPSATETLQQSAQAARIWSAKSAGKDQTARTATHVCSALRKSKITK